MNTVAVLGTDAQLRERAAEAVSEVADDFQLIVVDNPERVNKHLNYEFPEINVVYMDDLEIPGAEVLAEMRRDPWLHFGGLIAVYSATDPVAVTEAARGLNLVATIPYEGVATYLLRALRIMREHRQIVYQREIHSLLRSHLSGLFVLDNDPFDLNTYSNLLANFLFNTGLVGNEQRDRFHVALMELLVNAIEHGNCRISYEEKSAHLGSGGDPMELIRHKNEDPAIAARKVHLRYRVTPEVTVVTIRDEGEGFDWRRYSVVVGEEGLLESHGRGIVMARHYVSDIAYNDSGNEVTMRLEHNRPDEPVIPRAFAQVDEMHVSPGQLIFTEGEESSHLYYIVSGSYRVTVAGRVVSTLTPADMFVGEMSFLLNNRRSATVTAVTDGLLLRIDKDQFVQTVREHPHYGILLARILANRLVALHHLGG